MSQDELLTGTRRVLVTGGGSGIGRAVAEALLREGASVVVSGRREAPLCALADAFPGRAFARPADLTVPSERDTLLERAATLMGRVDGLVHSAGQVLHQPPGHIDEAALRAQLEVNLVAPLRLGERAVAELEEGGGVVFVGSTLARRPVLTSAAYSAAKAGLLAAASALALAGVARRIRFNTVHPGVVDTEMVRALRLAPGERVPAVATQAERVKAQVAALASLHPMKRLGTPEEVAEAVVHLLGAAWTTGAELVVDGGLLLRE